jgi:hypothetical protein
MTDIQKIMDGFETKVSLGHASSQEDNDRIVVVLEFSEKGFGFGEITIVQTSAGVFVDTEYMNLDRVKRYLAMLLDKAITDTDEDPERHALFNREMNRTCGSSCMICRSAAEEFLRGKK